MYDILNLKEVIPSYWDKQNKPKDPSFLLSNFTDKCLKLNRITWQVIVQIAFNDLSSGIPRVDDIMSAKKNG